MRLGGWRAVLWALLANQALPTWLFYVVSQKRPRSPSNSRGEQRVIKQQHVPKSDMQKLHATLRA